MAPRSGPPGDHPTFHAWLRTLEGGEERLRVDAFLPGADGVPDAVPDVPWGDLARALGVTPWRHQAEAWRRAAAGDDVVAATPTASGKSLTYQLPLLDAARSDGTAVALFPTKALAEDQRAALRDVAVRAGLASVAERVARYDGDTPRDARAGVREGSDLLLTNPDMLHLGILALHPAWAPFLARLRWIVVDELHVYRGVLGSHVGNVLRRLLRVAAHYGAAPHLLTASATVANPGELFTALTGREAAVVTADDAPRAPREVAFWVPPDRPGEAARRRSPVAEAADLAVAFARADVKSLFFCNSRRAAERVASLAHARLGEADAAKVDAYRAGYDADERRRIEAAFKAGEVTVLAATSALELGVDVGGVDAVAMVGYPGSSMSFWQRAGRAGRAGGRALTVLVPGDDPLDDHYLTHPDALLDGSVEAAVADAHNEVVHAAPLPCAAAERPIDPREPWLAPDVDLAALPDLREGDDGRFHARRWFPHRHVALRGEAGGKVRLVAAPDGRSLGSVDVGRAVRELHEGAVHLHRGDAYLVVELDLDARRATLLPHLEDWFTSVRSETRIDPLDAGGRGDGDLARALGLPDPLRVGRVRVSEVVHGYVRKRARTGAVLEERPLDLPPAQYDTQAVWIEYDAIQAAGAVAPDRFPSAMHALEHTMIGLLPAFVLCERADVGGVSYPLHPDLGMPAMFVYDGAPGGVGYAAAGAHQWRRWIGAARDRLRSCPCAAGCPRCVLSPKCGNGNQYLDKDAAADLADATLEALTAGATSAVLDA